jgi:hypothetical protein
MRIFAGILAIALSVPLTACSEQIASPSEPVVTFNPALFIYPTGFVLNLENQCISGAVVDILDSPERALIGRQAQQRKCNFDDGIGYDFGPVAAGTRLRLRASAQGYQPQQREIILGLGSTGMLRNLTV